MKWLVLVLLAGCWGSHPAPPRPPRTPAPFTQQWTVRVEAPEGARDFSFETVAFVAATRGERPTLFANARFGTEHATVIATEDRPRIDYRERIGYREVISVGLDAAATIVTTLRGEPLAIPFATVPRDALWYDLAPGILAIMKSATGARFVRFDGSATPTWVVDVPDAHLNTVRRVEWFANGDPLISLDHHRSASLVRLRLATHTIVPVATVRVGGDPQVGGPERIRAVALAERVGQLAVVLPKLRAGCTTCESVEIYDLSGKLVTGFALPDPGDRTTGGKAMSLGFTGRLLWMYAYSPASRNDFNGWSSSQRCGYEVYDVTTGKRVRTLADATGEWAKLTKDCKVRALLPTSDGGAIAFAAVDWREALVIKLAAPP